MKVGIIIVTDELKVELPPTLFVKNDAVSAPHPKLKLLMKYPPYYSLYVLLPYNLPPTLLY